MRIVSPAARAEERVPLKERDVSSVVLPEVRLEVWKMPALSSAPVMEAVVVGASVSTMIAVPPGFVLMRAAPTDTPFESMISPSETALELVKTRSLMLVSVCATT